MRELIDTIFSAPKSTLISANSPANRSDSLDVRPQTPGIRADLLFSLATRVLFAEKIVFSHRLHEFPHRLVTESA